MICNGEGQEGYISYRLDLNLVQIPYGQELGKEYYIHCIKDNKIVLKSTNE